MRFAQQWVYMKYMQYKAQPKEVSTTNTKHLHNIHML